MGTPDQDITLPPSPHSSYYHSTSPILIDDVLQTWPGVDKLPDYKPTFPTWKSQPLSKFVPQLDALGIDLLSVRRVFA
jgi:hypothetical protein